MAKRGAEEQISKDDERSDGEDGSDPGVRSAPLAPVEGRQIRGMPKRRGLGGAPAPISSTAAPAPGPAALTGFSFGAPPTTGSTPFVFGSGAGSAPTPAPSAPSAPAPAAAASPFAGFSFAAKPSAPTPTADDAPKASAPAFGFGLKPTPFSAAPAPAAEPVKAPSSSSPFSFGAKPFTPAAPSPATASAPASGPAQPPKPFANFSFANTSSTSSLAPTVSATSVSSTTSPFSFGGSAAQSSVSTPSFAPTISKSAETPVVAPATPVSIPSDPSPSQSTPPDEKQVSYYTSLRGLNTSFLSFLTASLENDPFLDLANAVPGLVKQYKSYVDVAATKAGWRPEGSKPAASANGESSKPLNGLPKPPALPTIGGFALPKAPTASTTSTPTPSFGGFTPSLPAAPANGAGSPFSFGGAKPASASTPKKPSAEVTQLVQDVISGKDGAAEEQENAAPKPFTFGLSTAPAASESAKKPTALFSFSPSAPLHPPTPESKKFAPSASLEAAGTPAKLGKFGPGGSQPQLAFGGAAAAKPFSFGVGAGSGSPAAPASGGSTGFSFGGSSASSTMTATKPAFFGSSSQPTSTSAFSFGGASTEKKAPPASSSSFSFTPLAAKPAATSSAGEGQAADGESTPAPGSPSKNLAETIGAGEENEDTIVEQRGKLHSLVDGKFSLEGLGQFKLKRTKEGGKRRLLMRTDGNGNVILNMSLNKSFKPTAEGPTVRFLGFNKDGKPVPYALRVKNAQVATELSNALEKEVEALEG